MSEETATITRSRAITLINNSIDNFATFYDCYCYRNEAHLSQEQKELYERMNEALYIVRKDEKYRNDLEHMPQEDLTAFLLSCKEMAENHDLLVKFSYPKGKIVIVEDGKKRNVSYEAGWIIVTDNDVVLKIINNFGHDIIFVDKQGVVIKQVKYSSGSYTDFFGKNIGLTKSKTNDLFVKAHYSWVSGEMTGGYKAFDLNGNEIEATIDGNIAVINKEETDTSNMSIQLKKDGSLTVVSKVSNRIPQNDLRPDRPNGPCLFRALLAAVEEKISQAFSLQEMKKIQKICSKKENNYIGNKEDEFFVNKHSSVIKTALSQKGYNNAIVVWSSQRKATVSGNADYTIRYIKSKKHFQLGDKNGNLLWEPYKYNNPDNAYRGKADGFNEITISLGGKND
jgi:hypothetical protein